MKAKTLITFLVFGIFIVTHSVSWGSANNWSSVTQDSQFLSNEFPPNEFPQDIIDEQFETLGITLHPGTEYTSQSKANPLTLQHCKSLVYRTLKSLPAEPVRHLKNLTLYFADTGRRGLGGGDTIILRCQNVTDEELVAVLVHEMGHIMDTGVMSGKDNLLASALDLAGSADEAVFMDGTHPVSNDDPSVEFYSISFKDSTTLKDDANPLDFVSGYAMTDPFEDFAESYAYYVLHGDDFRTLAKRNKKLRQKYEFLKEKVFNDVEYYNGDETGKSVDFGQRNYDVTILPYSIDKFFII